MTSVSSTADVYDVLLAYNIPVVLPDASIRSVSDILSDLFRAWKTATDGTAIIDAIRFITPDAALLTEEQKLALDAMSDEQTRLLFAKQAAEQAEESDVALDEFLGSFKIIGGDDT